LLISNYGTTCVKREERQSVDTPIDCERSKKVLGGGVRTHGGLLTSTANLPIFYRIFYQQSPKFQIFVSPFYGEHVGLENKKIGSLGIIFLSIGLIALVSFSLPFLSEELSAYDLDKRIQRVENGLYELSIEGLPIGEKLTIAERMEYYNVSGASIAIINDYKIEWAKGYGVLEAGENQPVTPDTLFQSASIGKPVTASVVLHFVEQGLLDLDENVNDKLVSWKVPENEFTAQEKVTLRRLLSHTAGVTVHGFRGYAQGEKIPTLLQVLDGEYPANNMPIRVDVVPGTQWRYSGGGYMIVQQLLEDVVGKPFPEIMQETVLGPTGMTSSIYAVPLPESLESRAATAHNSLGEPTLGKWYELVCMGAGGGLWTTPSDLARFSIEIMLSRDGQSNKVLSQEMVDQMLTPQIDLNELYRMGLGVLLEGEGQVPIFRHGGGNYPGFLSLLIVFPENGNGLVVMTNGWEGESLYNEILMSVDIEYDYPPY